MSECPVGCGRAVGAGKLVCGPCWGEVPAHLQQEVYRTWRAYRAVPSGFSAEVQEMRRAARLAYQEARDNALSAIT